jgi:hypothetical protein
MIDYNVGVTTVSKYEAEKLNLNDFGEGQFVAPRSGFPLMARICVDGVSA